MCLLSRDSPVPDFSAPSYSSTVLVDGKVCPPLAIFLRAFLRCFLRAPILRTAPLSTMVTPTLQMDIALTFPFPLFIDPISYPFWFLYKHALSQTHSILPACRGGFVADPHCVCHPHNMPGPALQPERLTLPMPSLAHGPGNLLAPSPWGLWAAPDLENKYHSTRRAAAILLRRPAPVLGEQYAQEH